MPSAQREMADVIAIRSASDIVSKVEAVQEEVEAVDIAGSDALALVDRDDGDVGFGIARRVWLSIGSVQPVRSRLLRWVVHREVERVARRKVEVLQRQRVGNVRHGCVLHVRVDVR